MLKVKTRDPPSVRRAAAVEEEKRKQPRIPRATKHFLKMKSEGGAKYKDYKEMDKLRKREDRKKLKQKLSKSPEALQARREWEKVRKREQRAKMKNLLKDHTSANENVQSTSSKDGRKSRWNRERRKMKKKQNEENSRSCLKIKNLVNENRRLKRKIKKQDQENQEVHMEDQEAQIEDQEAQMEDVNTEDSSDEVSEQPSAGQILYGLLTPKTKKKVCAKVNAMDEEEITPIRKVIRKEVKVRIERRIDEIEKESELQKKVADFMLQEPNSVDVPDKKKCGIRYRMSNLHVLHEKFISESSETVESCSYSWFCKLVPSNIIKPKPQDWGTCLCMTCLNPELKIEALKKTASFKNHQLTEQDICNYNEEKFEEFINKVKDVKGIIKYVVWQKDKDEKTETKSATYHSRKYVKTEKPKKFAAMLRYELKELKQHIENQKSQFRRIKEVKNKVNDETTKSKAIRIDWSENGKIYQTRQEKGAYYGDGVVQVGINTAVLYECQKPPRSMATVSDDKNHKAAATWASLEKLLEKVDLSDTSTLYIISDSPINQYRNMYYFYLAQLFAFLRGVVLIWVFTETGHGKGPMDGVGAVVKNAIEDVVSFNPDMAIQSTQDLMSLMPPLEVSEFFSLCFIIG